MRAVNSKKMEERCFVGQRLKIWRFLMFTDAALTYRQWWLFHILQVCVFVSSLSNTAGWAGVLRKTVSVSLCSGLMHDAASPSIFQPSFGRSDIKIVLFCFPTSVRTAFSVKATLLLANRPEKLGGWGAQKSLHSLSLWANKWPTYLSLSKDFYIFWLTADLL